MKGVQCYELFGGIALKIHTFSFSVSIATRKTSSISFSHPTARKNCYRHSFMPRTVVEWNRLPATIREASCVDTFKARLCSIKLSTHFTRYKIA